MTSRETPELVVNNIKGNFRHKNTRNRDVLRDRCHVYIETDVLYSAEIILASHCILYS